jgi:hypothetical protein
MKPSRSLKVFRDLLKERALSAQRMIGADALAIMSEFYASERAEGCDTAAQGDMLLYQWGVYDWGHGPSFQFDITRQFILGDGEDHEIFQLQFTLHYPVSEEAKALRSGNRWCKSPAELEEFQAFIRQSAAFGFAAQRMSDKVEIAYDCAG